MRKNEVCYSKYVYFTHVDAGSYEGTSDCQTGYISSSSYKDENGQETGGKGDLKFVEGSVNVPVSQKLNERKQPTVWIVSAGGGYTSMNNKNLQSYIDIDQTINLQLGVTNIRPVSKKWMLLTTVGVGVYTASDIRMKNVLGQGGAVFIRQLKPNLSLGAGLAINNTFGYPMIFRPYTLIGVRKGVMRSKFP